MPIILRGSYQNALTLFRMSTERGCPVIFPTDTIYGIGAPLASVAANEAVSRAKHRADGIPFPVLIGSRSQLDALVCQTFTPEQQQLMDERWPGSTTFVMKARPEIDPFFTKEGTIAVRLLKPSWLGDAIAESGPVTATSANISGVPYSPDVTHIISTFIETTPLFLVGNPGGITASSIIDISNSTIRTIR